MTGVESFLKRELSIRFIDARSLATEAKNNLNIMGYPSAEQKELLKVEAVRIFGKLSEEEKLRWRETSEVFNEIKAESIRGSSHHSLRSSGSNHSLREFTESGSVCSRNSKFNDDDDSVTSRRSGISAKLKASSWLPGARRQHSQ